MTKPPAKPRAAGSPAERSASAPDRLAVIRERAEARRRGPHLEEELDAMSKAFEDPCGLGFE
jgi:hypothetical protein